MSQPQTKANSATMPVGAAVAETAGATAAGATAAAATAATLATSVVGSTEQKKILTHNGVFHADEVTAVAILLAIPEFRNAQIVRTRDAKVFATADVVVDVGGKFDEKTMRYDHHQPDFKVMYTGPGARSVNTSSPMSAVGIVWQFHGADYVRAAKPNWTPEYVRPTWHIDTSST